jgi:hypothetical protein
MTCRQSATSHPLTARPYEVAVVAFPLKKLPQESEDSGATLNWAIPVS